MPPWKQHAFFRLHMPVALIVWMMTLTAVSWVAISPPYNHMWRSGRDLLLHMHPKRWCQLHFHFLCGSMTGRVSQDSIKSGEKVFQQPLSSSLASGTTASLADTSSWISMALLESVKNSHMIHEPHSLLFHSPIEIWLITNSRDDDVAYNAK